MLHITLTFCDPDLRISRIYLLSRKLGARMAGESQYILGKDYLSAVSLMKKWGTVSVK